MAEAKQVIAESAQGDLLHVCLVDLGLLQDL